MAKNIKDINHNGNSAIRANLVRNGEKRKRHNIDCCEGGMKLEDIATNNVGEYDLNLE